MRVIRELLAQQPNDALVRTNYLQNMIDFQLKHILTMSNHSLLDAVVSPGRYLWGKVQRKSHRNNDNSNRQTAKVSRNKVIVDFEKKYASVEGNPCLVCRPQSTQCVSTNTCSAVLDKRKPRSGWPTLTFILNKNAGHNYKDLLHFGAIILLKL